MDEPYYVKRLEEVRTQIDNLLMAKGGDDSKDTYQIRSSKSNDEQMCHHIHGMLFAKLEGQFYQNSVTRKSLEDTYEDLEENAKEEGSNEEDVETTGRCFLSTTPKSPMTSKVRDLIFSLNVTLISYLTILCRFDETCSYLNDILISMSSEAKKSKASL